MALARLAQKHLQQRAASAHLLSRSVGTTQDPRCASQLLRRLCSAAEKSDSAHEVAVAEGGKKPKLSPRRRRRGGPGGLWRSSNRDFAPAVREFFPSGIGNALLQATENINRLMENLSPSQLIGRAKEDDSSYKLRYRMPGVAKEDVKVTVNDGVLSIRGEHKKEEEEESDDEFWSERSYGYYNTSLVLPEDAKVDGIRAEMKHGVLTVVIPKEERVQKDVKEVEVN